MGTCCRGRHFWALMRRNWIYRKRAWVSSFFQILFPVLTVLILLTIKESVSGSAGFKRETVDPVFRVDSDVVNMFSFGDFVTEVRKDRKCLKNPKSGQGGGSRRDSRVNNLPYYISGIEIRKSWPVPFLKCDSRICGKPGKPSHNETATSLCEINTLVVAPTNKEDALANSRVESFAAYIYDKYPQINRTNFNILNKDGEYVPLGYDFISTRNPTNNEVWTESSIKSYIKSGNYGRPGYPKIAVAVMLEGGSNNKEYAYEVRINSTNFNSNEFDGRPTSITTPNTKKLFDSFAKTPNGPCATQGGAPSLGNKESQCTAQYIYNGALPIQRLVHDWILKESGSPHRVAENGVSFVNFPERKYVKNGFYKSIETFAPLLLVLGLMYPMASTVRALVQEKELRQKELMKMMSISDFSIELAWFISLFMFFSAAGILMTIICDNLYESSNGFLLFIFWELAFLSILMFTFVMASFNSKPSRATLFSIMLFFVGYFITISVKYDDGSMGAIRGCSLHPVTAISYGIQIIGSLEDKGVGLKSSTIGNTDNPSGFTFSNCISYLIQDIILWGLLSWYLNRTVKGDYGQSLPYNFCFTKKYWFPNSDHKEDDEYPNEDDSKTFDDSIPIEDVSDTLKAQEKEGNCVAIRDLTKRFDTKTAVDGLNLTMYNGQITALLGHNGAGKTTTINMLTGMVQPTTGYAVVNGNNIINQMNQVRENVGICLQHDCLFPMLTVREHIEFFARVKGLYENKTKEEAEEAITTAIEDVALSEKMNTFSKDLSGGMKRKLSVAIAFCGDSSVVFLDEPTSGMDPFSRRFTWNVIRQYRQNRCIVLTTHFMDEADLLGDRIAIMSEGQLRCCGSSLFLKKRYGVGYQLTIEKLPRAGNNKESMGIEDDLKKIVTGGVDGANLLSNVGTEMSFQLPIGASAQFIKVFEDLDSLVGKDEIVTYGVSITTLDEVFLMVARGEIGKHEHLRSSQRASDDMNSGAVVDTKQKSYRSAGEAESQVGVFSTHVQSLLRKRAVNFKRDKKAWCCTAALPIIVSLVGFLIVTLVIPSKNLPSLKLSLERYNPSVTDSATNPRNPVLFNNPGNFSCQPGNCLYSRTRNVGMDGKVTHTCGSAAQFLPKGQCSITESTDFANKFEVSGQGARGVGADVDSISESSKLLFDKSDASNTSTYYGAIYFTHDKSSQVSGNSYDDLAVKTCSNKTGGENCDYFRGLGYVVSTNFTGLHSSLIYQSLADEAIIRKSTADKTFKISPTIHPLPLTQKEDNYSQAENSFSAWFLLCLSFPFITGAYATFVVTERMTKAKHLQTVAGVKPEAYWISTHLWDIVNYQIPLWSIVILMYATGLDAFTRNERDIPSGVIAVLVLFGPAAAGFTYCLSFLFGNPSTANLFVIVFNFFVGFAGPMVCFILRLIQSSTNTASGGDSKPDQSLKLTAQIIEGIGRFIPSFAFGKALLFTVNIDTFATFNSDPDLSVWSPDILQTEVIFLAWEAIVYVWIAVMIDKLSTKPRAVQMWKSFVSYITCRCCCKPSSDDEITRDETPLDDDVANEVTRIHDGQGNSDLIVLNDLTKMYNDTKLAVDHMTFGIPAGECFGLLGINGAGKTTTMAMLTAEFPPSEGDATLAGYSVTNNPEQTRRRIGYCPQFDAHFQNMTGREHVELYASIKGIPKELVKEAAASKLKEVGLNEYDSDRLSAGYSGGMKRKLSVACATIGNPEIVFLDEPSTGMDPVARRDLWKVISNMVMNDDGKAQETSIILTTHSMEECEALCPRIGIMAGGKLRCLGSAQHLKTRFGQGFQVEVKVRAPDAGDDDFNEIKEKIYTLFPRNANTENDVEDPSMDEEITLNLHQTIEAAKEVASDDYLADMINEDNPNGYLIYKNASSTAGASIKEVTHFFSEEMRMKNLQEFFNNKYSAAILRERQDSKVRYEVGFDGIKIASLFSEVESVKEELQIADYGISQTSLEQVFNMHAAEAEAKKKGTTD
jgi:ATP-binding cassette subfamily A (ABC1) protein 3